MIDWKRAIDCILTVASMSVDLARILEWKVVGTWNLQAESFLSCKKHWELASAIVLHWLLIISKRGLNSCLISTSVMILDQQIRAAYLLRPTLILCTDLQDLQDLLEFHFFLVGRTSNGFSPSYPCCKQIKQLRGKRTRNISNFKKKKRKK